MRKRLLTVLLALAALGFAARLGAAAQGGRARAAGDEPLTLEKARDIRRLLGLLQVVERELKNIDPIFDSFKQRMPEVPAKEWDEVKKFMREEFTAESIMGMYVPVYSRRFTAKEIKQLIEFYQSPVGHKWVAESAAIESELFLRGIERGMRLGDKLKERLKAKGYNVPKA